MVKIFRCIAVAMMDSQVERLWNTGGLAPVVRQKKLLDPLEVESWAMELWKKDMWKSALEEVWFFKMGTWMGEMMVGEGADDDVLGFLYKGVQKNRKKVGVSKNSGTPKSSILIGLSIINCVSY